MSKDVGRVDRVSCWLGATPQDVFAAFGDGGKLMEWLPPSNMTGEALEYEFRRGGRFRLALRFTDGSAGGKTNADTDISEGRFIEIEYGRLIKQTIVFEGLEWNRRPPMQMEWHFAAQRDGTQIMVIASDVPSQIQKGDHQQGIASTLANLARFLGVQMTDLSAA